MKSIVKKAGFLLLAVFIGLSLIFVINEISSRQLSDTNKAANNIAIATNSYPLSRHFSRRNFVSPSQSINSPGFVYPSQNQNSQDFVYPSQNQNSQYFVFPSQNQNSQNFVYPSQNQNSQSTVNPSQNQNSQSTVNTSQNQNSQNTVSPSQYPNSQNNGTSVNLPANVQPSSNWGGYIVTPATNKGYTSISGSWKVPDITTNNPNGVAAQWIGLGGVTSSDLLQMGTIEQIENGQPMAEVFWEKLPDAAQNIMSVPIGSTVKVSISKSSGLEWNLTFTATTPDNRRISRTISTTLIPSYAQGVSSSAEWISEDPAGENGQLMPLADMGTVNYKSATVNGQPINASSNNVQPVAMVSDYGNVVISPSTLGTDGKSFTTTNTNSSYEDPAYTGQALYVRYSITRHGRNR